MRSTITKQTPSSQPKNLTQIALPILNKLFSTPCNIHTKCLVVLNQKAPL